MNEPIDYPDSKPDGLGDLKEIKRLPSMQKVAPKIRWGNEYMSWPDSKKLYYAERLANSMNHAADVLQKERNELIKIAEQQEKQIKHIQKQHQAQGDLLHRKMLEENAAKQELYQEIVRLKQETKQQQIRIRQLEAVHDD